MKRFPATILLCWLILPCAGQVRVLDDSTYVVPRALVEDYVFKSFEVIPACESLSSARASEIEALQQSVAARTRVIALTDSVNANLRQSLSTCEQIDAALEEALQIAKRNRRRVRLWKAAAVVSTSAAVTLLLTRR